MSGQIRKQKGELDFMLLFFHVSQSWVEATLGNIIFELCNITCLNIKFRFPLNKMSLYEMTRPEHWTFDQNNHVIKPKDADWVRQWEGAQTAILEAMKAHTHLPACTHTHTHTHTCPHAHTHNLTRHARMYTHTHTHTRVPVRSLEGEYSRWDQQLGG